MHLNMKNLKKEKKKKICIAYRILLTMRVTIAFAERIFLKLKLKLIKSYLRSTMSQQKLSRSTILSITNKMLEEFEYKNLISQFTSQKTRKTVFK